MNKKILTIIFVILLFIPSYVAIGYYSSTKAGPNSPTDVQSLAIKDPDGNEWSFSSEDNTAEATDMINLFFGMRTNAVSVESLPEAISGTDFFLISLLSFGEQHDYQFYFTNRAADAYFMDKDGAVYKIAETDAEAFLGTKCSASLYDTTVPQLVVGGNDGERVSPSSAVWSYKTFDGSYVPFDTSAVIDSEVKTCDIEGGFVLSFTEAPDYASLVVREGDREIYNDTIENVDSLSLGDVDKFTVTVTAKWFENTERSFYGEATYTFVGDVIEPATFYLGQTSVTNGRFVVIGGKNVADESKIGFTSNPSIEYTPVFYREGDYVYALVPISYELENGSVQNYTFTLSYGGVSQEMYLTVEPYEYKSSTSAITAAVEAATYTEETRQEAETVLGEIAKSKGLSQHAFSGTFLRDVVGEGSEGKISPGFGRYIKVEATGTEFRHTGCDYNVKAGTEVYAVNSGTVVYAGNLALTGYIVVIDHGWGLRSWYCHLSENSVKVGDTVEKGAVIGLAGDTGFTAKNRTHVGLTVNDVPVCIYGLWDEAVAIPSMN